MIGITYTTNKCQKKVEISNLITVCFQRIEESLENNIEQVQNTLDGDIEVVLPNRQNRFLVLVKLGIINAIKFLFGQKLYKQQEGTAIGTRAAPRFVNIYMGWWEGVLLEGWKGAMVDFFRRYIDDLFFLWHGMREELQEFVDFANSIMPSIKVTVDFDNET